MALQLQPATVDDLDNITDLWYRCFNDPNFLAMIPDTPAVRQWWHDANRHDLLHKPSAYYWKVVDPANNNHLVAYAKWDLSPAHERGPRFPPWHGEMDKAKCDAYFIEGLEKERKRLFGEKKNYYLDMLATDPAYRRRGAGGMLVQWGCEVADRDGMPVYIDATQEGKLLYSRFGFEDRSGPGCAERGTFPVVREPERN
ncbi:hypothetical protein AWENTII_009312 [Aspergillus wentii]